MQTFANIPRFHYLIVLATLFPLLATPLGITVGINDFFDQFDATIITLALGNGHVAATSFFFIDNGARHIVRENPYRFIIIPLGLAAIFATFTYIAGRDGWRYLVFINVLYLFFHYQKQNFGVMSLANRGLPRQARHLVDGIIFLPMTAGCILYGQYILTGSSLMAALAPYSGVLHALAWTMYACGVLSFLVLLHRHSRELNPVAKLLAISTCLFFAPLLFYADSPATAFSMFAAAHGAQYLLIMSYTIAGTRNLTMYLRATVTIGVVWIAFELLEYNFTFAGILMGMTWGHYMIDARIWKLSLPDSREYIMSRIKQFV